MNRLRFKRLRKPALFLSIEVVAVIIIIALLVGIVVAGIVHLIKSYKIYKVSSEFATYAEAVTNFRNTYTYLPGDLSVNSLSGALADPTAALGTSINDIAGLSGVAATDKVFENGIVGPAKSMLAFRELALTGLIPKSAVNIGVVVNFATTKLSAVSPTAGFDGSLMWIFGADSLAGGTCSAFAQNTVASANPAATVRGSLIYNPCFPGYADIWASTPRLALVRKSGAATVAGTSTVQQVAVEGAWGGLTSNLAASIDVKLDNGLPATGTIISDNAGNGTAQTDGATGGCSVFKDGTLASTNVANDFTDSSKNIYRKNSSTDPSQSCITTFLITTTA